MQVMKVFYRERGMVSCIVQGIRAVIYRGYECEVSVHGMGGGAFGRGAGY